MIDGPTPKNKLNVTVGKRTGWVLCGCLQSACGLTGRYKLKMKASKQYVNPFSNKNHKRKCSLRHGKYERIG